MNAKPIINCYNPGYDLITQPCVAVKECGSNYSMLCMYNTQGVYVCQPDKSAQKDTSYGYTYILSDVVKIIEDNS